MSTLAEITVKQCDCCSAVTTLSNEHQWESHRVLWYGGYRVDYCSGCKVVARNLQRIGEDLAERKRAIRALEDSKKLAEVDYVN